MSFAEVFGIMHVHMCKEVEQPVPYKIVVVVVVIMHINILRSEGVGIKFTSNNCVS